MLSSKAGDAGSPLEPEPEPSGGNTARCITGRLAAAMRETTGEVGAKLGLTS